MTPTLTFKDVARLVIDVLTAKSVSGVVVGFAHMLGATGGGGADPLTLLFALKLANTDHAGLYDACIKLLAGG